MNSGSSGIVPGDTVTTGTSGMGGAGVEAASFLQPGSPVRPRTSVKQSILNVSLLTRFCVVMFAINRSSGIIRSLRAFTPSSNLHDLIYDTACQTAGGDELGPLLMDFPQ
jgi:hypothetical protein